MNFMSLINNYNNILLLVFIYSDFCSFGYKVNFKRL